MQAGKLNSLQGRRCGVSLLEVEQDTLCRHLCGICKQLPAAAGDQSDPCRKIILVQPQRAGSTAYLSVTQSLQCRYFSGTYKYLRAARDGREKLHSHLVQPDSLGIALLACASSGQLCSQA